MIRHQLPVRSPLPFRAVRKGVPAALGLGTDPRLRLRDRLAQRTGATSALLTDSGTSALRIVLEALKGAGQEPVALPAFGCYDVVTAAAGAEVRVDFYDLDPWRLSPSLDSLQGAIARGARAVVVAPLYGFPLDWDGVCRIAAEAGAVVVEDAAQAHGSSWKGRRPGTFGQLVVLSFGRGKGWTAGGGGAVLVRDPTWKASLAGWGGFPGGRLRREAAEMAGLGAQWALARPGVYGIPRAMPRLRLGETRYREPWPPGPMGRGRAAAALASEAAACREVDHRRRNANEYRALLADLEEEEPRRPPTPVIPVEGGASGDLRFPILLSETDLRGGLPKDAIELGAARSYPRPLPDLPPARSLATSSGDPPSQATPGARLLATHLVTLPTHGLTTHADRRQLVFAGLRVAYGAEGRAAEHLLRP